MTTTNLFTDFEFLTVLSELKLRDTQKFEHYFPDCLPTCVATSPRFADHLQPDGTQRCCRVLYQKHLAFFRWGANYPERLLLAANRVGKTDGASYEIVCHLTGDYPTWWEGRRFEEAGDWWAAGDTAQTTRDILQLALLGPMPHGKGTGMIPVHRIRHTSPGRIPLAVDTIWVNHITGGISSLQFKSFDQGRISFQGTIKQGVWLDEEPDEGIVAECVLRTMTTNGILIYTFTPLQGLTPFIQTYLECCEMVTPSGIAPASQGFWGSVDHDDQQRTEM
jgi:phage terminase large subunit-like protein